MLRRAHLQQLQLACGHVAIVAAPTRLRHLRRRYHLFRVLTSAGMGASVARPVCARRVTTSARAAAGPDKRATARARTLDSLQPMKMARTRARCDSGAARRCTHAL